MMLRAGQIIQRDVQQVPQIMMIPRSQRSELRSQAIGPHCDPVVSKERVAQPRERMKNVVVIVVREHAAELESRHPRVALEIELGEMTIGE